MRRNESRRKEGQKGLSMKRRGEQSKRNEKGGRDKDSLIIL